MINHKYDDECYCAKCGNEWMNAFSKAVNRGDKKEKKLYLKYIKNINDEFKEERKEFIKWFRNPKHLLSWGWIKEYIKNKNTNHVKMIYNIAKYFLNVVYPDKKINHNERVDFYQLIEYLSHS